MRKSWRLPVALVTAVVVAQAAVIIMRPRDRGPEPVPVDPRAYFSAAQIDRADDFRSGQRWLFLAQTAIGLGVLVVIVRHPPRRLTGLPRPLLAGAATAAAISLAGLAAGLPLAVVARERAKDVGLVTQDWVGYAGDVAKNAGIGAVIAAAGGALFVLGLRRLGERWWIAGAVIVVAYGAATTYASPVVLAPLFNDFRKLPAGELRSDVLRLAREAGVDAGEVYEVDASRRTTAANAYVAGVGRTKRVVIYDNLIEDFTPAETRHVVAHELGHAHYHDLRNGLIWVAIVAVPGMWALAELTRRFGGPASAGARAVPAVALGIAIVVPVMTMVSNQLSRAVEARADAFALELTREPETLIGFQRRIAIQNVSDVDPPALYAFLFGTHPTTMQRIGVGEAFER
ncbi:MAG TPA: M48 family metalloprotease [Solirubrobacteraceae bacterium]|nr:M48 family metalloprotease [Solirubrobacteraceae bacterium]